MKTKSMARFALLAAFCGLFASACHTVRGVGKDIERAGERIQQGSR